MANVKKKIKKTKLKLSKYSILLVSIAGLVLLVAGGLRVQSYLFERQTLKELTVVNKELKVVYDNVLEINKDNVNSSYFRNDCSISHISWLEERVSCGPSGRIVIFNTQEPDNLRSILAEAGKNSDFDVSDIAVSGQTEATSVSATLKSAHTDVNCYVGYGKNQVTDQWDYWMTCRKDVKGILPGYTVVE